MDTQVTQSQPSPGADKPRPPRPPPVGVRRCPDPAAHPTGMKGQEARDKLGRVIGRYRSDRIPDAESPLRIGQFALGSL